MRVLQDKLGIDDNPIFSEKADGELCVEIHRQGFAVTACLRKSVPINAHIRVIKSDTLQRRVSQEIQIVTRRRFGLLYAFRLFQNSTFPNELFRWKIAPR